MSTKFLSGIDGLAAVNGATVTGAGGSAVATVSRNGASQSGNNFEWQSEFSTTMASVTAAGVFTGNGSGLSSLNAGALSTGTVPTARLGSGTASSSTVLRGDNTWGTVPPAGSTTQVQFNGAGSFGASPNLTWATASGTLSTTNLSVGTLTGLLKAAAGAVSVAAAGTDYLAPTGSGAGLTRLRAATFLLGIGTPATTGADKTNHLTATAAGVISKVWLNAKTGPTGADLVVDILVNGTSIWATTTANRAKIAAGSTTGSQTAFDTTAVSAGDVLTISIIQVGSTVAGQDVTVQLVY